MAYLFNSLSDDPEDPGKQNIFGGQQTNQGTTTQAGGTDAIQKTSTSGSVSSPGVGGSAAGPPAQSTAKAPAGYNPQAYSSAYSSAASNVRLPAQSLNRAGESLAKGEQALQEKANSYQQKAQKEAEGFKLSSDTLKNAIGGKSEDFQTVSKRLSGGSPALFGGFGGLDEVPNIDYVKDLGSLYRGEAGPSYTGGQARLDASLLRQNQGFRQQQSDLLARQEALRKADTSAQETETKKAQDMLSGAYSGATNDIRSQLGGYASQITKAAQDREAAEDARRAGLDPSKLAAKDIEALKAEAKKNLGGEAAARWIDEGNIDFNPYISMNRDVDWKQLLTADDVDQYNRAEGLLGNSDTLTQDLGGVPKDYEFKKDAAYNGLLDQIRQRQSEWEAKGGPLQDWKPPTPSPGDYQQAGPPELNIPLDQPMESIFSPSPGAALPSMQNAGSGINSSMTLRGQQKKSSKAGRRE